MIILQYLFLIIMIVLFVGLFFGVIGLSILVDRANRGKSHQDKDD